MGSKIFHPNRVDYYGAFHVHLVEAYPRRTSRCQFQVAVFWPSLAAGDWLNRFGGIQKKPVTSSKEPAASNKLLVARGLTPKIRPCFENYLRDTTLDCIYYFFEKAKNDDEAYCCSWINHRG
jgi:hypothetical protein